MKTKIDNNLQILELDKIFISKTNPRKSFDENALKELSESIKTNGVFQPILVRPIPDGFNSKNEQEFELVCGERRYKASLLAKQKSIPANIRYLNDDEAFELQLIENLERKDIHPLDEADAFKQMLDSGKYQIADIAAKMAKTETFIAGRLKLIDLIEPIREHFKAGYLGIGHATLIAKCDENKQGEIFADAKPWREEDEPNYGTYKELKETIADDLLNLDEAPFDIADDELIKGVCACTVCPKRSKANPMLFDEFQSEDSCFDEKCYSDKLDAFTQKELARIINENEDVCIIGSAKPDDFLLNLCKQFDVKILKYYDDYRTYKVGGFIEKQAFNISGNDIGKYETIWVKPIASNTNSELNSNDDSIKNDIAKIEERAKRALELDAEKIWTAVKEIDVSTFKNNDEPLSNNEKVALIVALASECYHLHSELDFVKNLNINKIRTEAVPDQLVNLTIRHFISHKLNVNYGSHENNNCAAAYKQLLEEYYSDEIKAIEASQKEIADKRIERSSQRIDALKSKIEVVEEKVVKGKKTSKAKK